MSNGDPQRSRPGRAPSEILDRLPPHNLDAERNVLGSLILNPNYCDEVVLIVRPDDFYVEAHRKLFAHVLEMHDSGKRIDATLLVERLRQKGDLEAVGGAAALADIVQSVPVAAHAVYYAKILREKAMLRDMIFASTEILRDAYDPTLEAEGLVAKAEERIFAIHDKRSNDQVASINDVLLQAFDAIDKRMQGAAGGTPTGFVDLDEMTGGLHGSELIILAARPSMGKTALAMNIAENVALKANVTTLFVSLEMSRQELAQRMLCSHGKINGKKFRSQTLSGDDRGKLVQAASALSKAPLFIDDSPSRTVTEIAALARRMRRRSNLGFIAIDYLQLIEPDNPKDPRQEQVAKIARRLKGMARELHVPVLCLAQLNRQAEAAKESRPKLSHLRESGAIEQDADVVMFIHRDEYGLSREEAEKQGVQGKADLIIAKQRNGPVGDVSLVWRQDYTTFENAALKPHADFAQFDGGF